MPSIATSLGSGWPVQNGWHWTMSRNERGWIGLEAECTVQSLVQWTRLGIPCCSLEQIEVTRPSLQGIVFSCSWKCYARNVLGELGDFRDATAHAPLRNNIS